MFNNAILIDFPCAIYLICCHVQGDQPYLDAYALRSDMEFYGFFLNLPRAFHPYGKGN